jgi:spore germination cell wall hydrolase CwlJ-like protein
VTAVIVLIVTAALKTTGSEDEAPAPVMATPSQIPTATPGATPANTPKPTATATPEPTPEPARYELTADERELVERVVMAEAGGESFDGQVLVDQCILNACEKDGERPPEIVVAYQYAKGRPAPTQSVRDAVAAVFDGGETVVDAAILYFYNPSKTTSRWHESQVFIVEVGGHRFFAEKGAGK